MAATINAFPPLHAFNSSRSWFLALITLLHVGVLWMLANGYSIELPVIPKGNMIILDELVTPPEPPPRPDKPIVVESVFVPKPFAPVLAPVEDSTAIQQRVTEDPSPPV
ncbi:MAG: hypothetical protein ACREUC_15110, partial [Steroidobacteraceae bacterium]